MVAAVADLKTHARLQTRVGIATGSVVVGDLIGAGASQEQAIVGETPNLAARLQGIADPNAVVIAESTRKLVGNLFELEDLGGQGLKGISATVRVHGRVWAARPATVESRFDALHATGLTELVGREEELELLLRRCSARECTTITSRRAIEFDFRGTIVKATVSAIIIALGASYTSQVIANDQSTPRVAFFGFQLINTSLQSTAPEEAQRIRSLDDTFQRKLNASGRFQLIAIPHDLDDAIAAASIANCNGCERDFALKAGADLAAWGTVQKVSNLILNINVYIEDAKAKKMLFVKSVDIRGNTDESWQRGLDYLLRHYLLNR